jgi:parallel beta-helix repeat protein
MAPRDLGTSALWITVIVVALVAVVVATAFAGLQIGGPDPGANGTRSIDACSVISDPGAYELTGNLENRDANACVRITASNVTFEGNGNRIDGVSAFGSGGVIVGGTDRNTTNVTVSNLTVTDWDDGVRYLNVTGGTVDTVTSANNRVGLAVLNGTGTEITNSTAAANDVYGVSIARDTRRTVLTNNTARANTLFGFHLVGVGGNTLEENLATANEYGFALIDADRNELIGNNASINRVAGYWLSAADRNLVERNYASNRFYGIYLADRSTNNFVVNNTIRTNAVGVRLVESQENVIERNTIRESRAEGILILSGDDNRLIDNGLAGNGHPLRVRDSTNVTQTNGTGTTIVSDAREGAVPTTDIATAG